MDPNTILTAHSPDEFEELRRVVNAGEVCVRVLFPKRKQSTYLLFHERENWNTLGASSQVLDVGHRLGALVGGAPITAADDQDEHVGVLFHSALAVLHR